MEPVLLLEAQDQTGEVFSSQTQNLLRSQVKCSSAGLELTELSQELSQDEPRFEKIVLIYSSQLSWAGPAPYTDWTSPYVCHESHTV